MSPTWPVFRVRLGLRYNGRQCSSAVEQRFRKPSVAGSIPAIGSILITGAATSSGMWLTGVDPSEVISIGHPIKVHRGGRVELPRATSPFDVRIEWIDQRRRAVKNQIPIPPQLNFSVTARIEIGGMPGVGYRRAEVHQAGIGVDIIP